MSVEALVRDGARGTGKYIPIGMEEALRTATMWLSMLRHGKPDALTICVGNHNDYFLASDWAQKFGTLQLYNDRVLSAANAPTPRQLNSKTTLVLAIGSGAGRGGLNTQQQLAKLRQQGAKIISINPVKTGLSALADQWICITPGQDTTILQLLANALAGQKADCSLLEGSGVDQVVFEALLHELKTHKGAISILAGRGVFAHRNGAVTSDLLTGLGADILASFDEANLPKKFGKMFAGKCEAIMMVGSHLLWKSLQGTASLRNFNDRFEGNIIAMSDEPPGFETCADLVFCGNAEENLLKLAARLGLDSFSDAAGNSPYKNGYADYTGNHIASAPKRRRTGHRQKPVNYEDDLGLGKQYPFWAISQKAGVDSNRALVFMNSATAKTVGLKAKDIVQVSSASASASVKAVLATMDDMDPQTLWSWGGSLFGELADPSAVDATTGQPAWFDLRVRIEKAE